MISGAQIRAARALLGMSGTELAERSKIGWSTLQRFESAEGVPSSRSGTLERIKETLEAAGVVFLGDPTLSPGVQLKGIGLEMAARKPFAAVKRNTLKNRGN